MQIITSVGGFAYGVRGADIHVFGDGLPLYLLANWPARPPSGPSRPRGFRGRRPDVLSQDPAAGCAGDLARLRSWRDSGPRLAVRWLHGPDGPGGALPVGDLAAESLEASWKVIAAFHGPDADWPEPGSQDMRLDGAAGLLLTVGHADQWQTGNLTWLLKNALLHTAGMRTRILMVAGTADPWPAIRAVLDSRQAGTSTQLLGASVQASQPWQRPPGRRSAACTEPAWRLRKQTNNRYA